MQLFSINIHFLLLIKYVCATDNEFFKKWQHSIKYNGVYFYQVIEYLLWIMLNRETLL